MDAAVASCPNCGEANTWISPEMVQLLKQLALEPIGQFMWSREGPLLMIVSWNPDRWLCIDFAKEHPAWRSNDGAYFLSCFPILETYQTL